MIKGYRQHLVSTLLIALFAMCTISLSQPVQAVHGMVVSSQELASRAGIDMLRRGGNAIDAAAAAGFALAVVHPQAGNIGGGGFMVIRFPDGRATTIDFREKAPGLARRDMYLNADRTVNAERSRVGALSVGVPGTVAGLCHALQKYGTLPLVTVLQPAIKLARDGFLVNGHLARAFAEHGRDFKKFPSTARVFLKPDGTPYKEGELFKQPDLARTLKLIASDGPDAFYRGPIAGLIVQQMKKSRGLMTENDLQAYRPVERAPVTGTFHDFRVISMGPPSSGGIALIEMLNILETFDLSSYRHNSAPYVHIVVEAMKRAFADRASYLGDPEFVAMPVSGLLSKAYARTLARSISLDRATPAAEIRNADPKRFHLERSETTHYSVVDENRCAVSVTTTLNGSFGSLLVVGGGGFLLNDEMDDFTSKPGVPNMYGLIQSEANAIEPNKRMLSSMTPTVVEKGNDLYMVIGSPGGPTIINTVLQVFLNSVLFAMNIEQAIEAGRFHHQWMPDRIIYEKRGLDGAVIEQLRKMGYDLRQRSQLGEVEGILYAQSEKMLYGHADRRGGGRAVGY